MKLKAGVTREKKPTTRINGVLLATQTFTGIGTNVQTTPVDLGPGGTFTATIPLAAYTEGDYTVTVRGFDVLGNRSATNATVVLHLTPSLWFSTAGNTNPPGVTGTADDADIFHWTGSRFGRTIDASAGPYNLPASGGGNANVDGFSRVDATHFYLSFTGQVSVPGLGDVQDEDVVYWNNGTWQLFFDGSANGNGVSGFDLDAISVRGGRLYFSVDSNTAPPGVGGAGDDSDIYVWNPGATPRYTRVVVATSIGVPANANVDGFVWRSATDYLFSFSGDTTVSGLGATQDEDVVRRTGTVWSVYFDGTARGLTSNNLDVDAFDIP